MNHSFDIKVAEKYGVPEAILLENIAFWIKKNIANKKNFHDGEYWTYNSAEAFTELFPYWTRRQIEHTLKKMHDKGLILKGCYNKMKYDRTTWYALTETSKSLYDICEINATKDGNQDTDYVEPIPDINTNIKPDINTKKKKVVKLFKPPTLQEIKEYVREKNLNLDSEYFHTYYTTAEWKDNKGNKIKNWKLKALTWSN
ncbi:MAG: hypothetical protein GY782_01005, partial [Gammaproteobacteria bacterium]|nr:hypothetical protein [Gammaproteobacteria bacterium]